MAKALDPISPLPQPPSRQDPANFASRGDAFLEALKVFSDELGVFIAGVNGLLPELENSPGTAAYLAAQRAAASAANAAQDAGRAAAAANEAAKRVSGISVLTVEPNAVAYVSPASFSVAADVRAIYQVDTAVSLVQAAAAGGWVTAADWDGSKTTVTITGSVQPSLSGVLVGPARNTMPRTGTAALLDAGEAPENAATLAQVDERVTANKSLSYAPQSIVAAPLGHRPPGWLDAECNAPACTLLAGSILPQFTAWGPVNGTISASSFFDSTLTPEKMWDGDPSTRWGSLNVGVEEVLTMNLQSPRDFDAVYIGAAGSTGNSFLNVEIFVDGVSNTATALAWTSISEIKTVPLVTPAVGAKQVKIRIPAQSGRVGCGTLGLRFTDVPTGGVRVNQGLQVAYADSGLVRLSKVLASPLDVELGAEPDGTKYIYADIDANGAFVGAGFTEVPPDAGPQRAGVTAFDIDRYSNTSNVLATGAISTIVASSSRGSSFNVSRVADGDPTTQWEANGSTGELAYRWSTSKTFIGIVYVNNSTTGGAKDFTLTSSPNIDGTDRTIQKTISGKAYAVARERSVYMFDAPVTAREIAMVVTAANGASFLDCSEFYPLIIGDWYNSAEIAMLCGEGNPLRRVHIGSVDKSGGTITSVNCYSLGTSAVIPVNNGVDCSPNTNYFMKQPFAGIAEVISEVYSPVNKHFIRTFNFYSSSGGVYFGNNVRWSALDSILVSVKTYISGNADGEQFLSGRMRVIATRGN